MRARSLLATLAGISLLVGGLAGAPATAAESEEVVTVAPSVECDSEYPSGILITNPASNTQTFFLDSYVALPDGTPWFGDGGWLAPGESTRLASGGAELTVEDATYSYVVSQSPQIDGSEQPTEPFDEVASGTYVYDCEDNAEYFVTSYDGTVWAVTTSSIVALTYADWERVGFPAPNPAPTDYVKYPWSPTVSAVTFFGQSADRWIWRHVSLQEWTRAGKPQPRAAGWIKDSVYYQWAESPQIFVQDVGGVKHALSYPEWLDSGLQPFDVRATQGFVKLSWDSNIAFLKNYHAGQGFPIGYAHWAAEGFPSPVVKSRLPGDQVYRNYGSPTIWYAGPTVNRPISYSEWSAMGQPFAPIRNVPGRPADKDCGDFASESAAQAEFDYYFPAYGDVHFLDGDHDGTACESHFRP